MVGKGITGSLKLELVSSHPYLGLQSDICKAKFL